MQLFVNSDILLFVRTSRLKWIGHFNGMESRRKVKHLTIILGEVDYETKKNMVELCTKGY
jgi:hypothetical protein